MSEIRGKIIALCISEARGTVKHAVPEAKLIKDYGLEGDAHAGHWHRQVSLLSAEQVEAFNERIASSNAQIQEQAQDAGLTRTTEKLIEPATEGTFGENILVSGIDLRKLPVGTSLQAGEVILKLSQIGKECHSHCQIFKRVGDCIMPREGVFATVEQGGVLKPGMELEIILPTGKEKLRAAVITLSDKGSIGARVDTSGPKAAEMLVEAGYDVIETTILPDEQRKIEHALKRLADSRQVDLIITTGGTGMSPRDVTPEATLAVATRHVPGIAEAIRYGSMKYTNRAMLSRGVAVLRNSTLIINLPGSQKAVIEALEIVLPVLEHGIRLAKGTDGECGRT
ncbi:MAG: molybdopterin-binding protein [Phascolarctobacterium sp.]